MAENNSGRTDWIWTSDWGLTDMAVPRLVYFRKEIIITEVPEKAEIRISADTKYKLYVNGCFVEIGPSKGDLEVWFVDTVDIGPYLQSGKNVIAVIVLRLPREGDKGCHGMFRTETPGLYFNGAVEGNDVSADRTWKTYIDRSVHFIREEEGFAPLILHEAAKGNALIADWKMPHFNAETWSDAIEYASRHIHDSIAPGNLNPRTVPFMYKKNRLFKGLIEGNDKINGRSWSALLSGNGCVEIPANTRVRVVLDAGEEMTGYLNFAFEGGMGAVINILESEAYVEDRVSSTSGAPIKKDRCDFVNGHLQGYTDIYTVGGFGREDNPEVYAPFWFRTFRFIELIVNTAEEGLVISTLDYLETGYPLNVITEVHTSDASFDKIWEISERALRRCMHETYEDCPFYEQLQYVMDTRAQILYTYSVSADDRLARKAIDDFARSQRSGGLLNACYPNVNPNVIPGFSIYYILIVHDHMMYFGDKRLVKRYLPVIDKILDFFDRHLTEDGLVYKIGGINGESRYWSFIDWTPEWNPTTGMPPAGLTGPITMESLLYIYGLMKASELADFIGRADTGAEYRSRADKVRAAVRTLCMDSTGMITDGPGSSNISQHCQVFGVLTKTLSVDEGRRNLLKTIEENGYAQCTVAMCFYLFRALEKTDLYRYTDRYWDIWRNMVKMNCTTTVESEDYSRSECHAWGALALYELPSAILGVRPSVPGYNEVVVKPHTEFLHHAKGTVITPKGKIDVSWEKDEKGKVNVWTNPEYKDLPVRVIS